jgi:hypothetical protein
MINKVTKNIILNAVKTHGRDVDKITSYVDDEIVLEVKEFLEWSFTNRGYLRHNNFDTYLMEFMNQIGG